MNKEELQKEKEVLNETQEGVVDTFYYENKSEIIKEFRENQGQIEPEIFGMDDEDIENAYGGELMEIAKEWYNDECDLIETQNSLRRY